MTVAKNMYRFIDKLMSLYSILIYYCILQFKIHKIVRQQGYQKVLIGDTGGYGHYASSVKIAEKIFQDEKNLILWIGWQKRFGSAKEAKLICPKLILIDLSFDSWCLKWYYGAEKQNQYISKKLRNKLVDKGYDVRILSEVYSNLETVKTAKFNRTSTSEFCYQSICYGNTPILPYTTVQLRASFERDFGIDFDSSLVIYLRDKGRNTKDITNWGRIGSPWLEYIKTIEFALSKKLNIFIIGDKNVKAIEYFKSKINSKLILNPKELNVRNSYFTTMATMCSKYYMGDMGGNNILRAYLRKKSLIINGFPTQNLIPYAMCAFKKIYYDGTTVSNLSILQINQIEKIKLINHSEDDILIYFKFYFQDIEHKLKNETKTIIYNSNIIEIVNGEVSIK
jgi:hypothetical protein